MRSSASFRERVVVVDVFEQLPSGAFDRGEEVVVAAGVCVGLFGLADRELGERVVEHASGCAGRAEHERRIPCLRSKFDEPTGIALDNIDGAYDNTLAVWPEVVATSGSKEWTSHQVQPVLEHLERFARRQMFCSVVAVFEKVEVGQNERADEVMAPSAAAGSGFGE